MTTNTEPLRAQLQQFQDDFKARIDPARVQTMEKATGQLRDTGIEASALKAGASAPQVTLTDVTGRAVQLRELWQQGPLVVVFYRGGWCPYCNLELRAWQTQLPELEKLGARLTAISPQTPDNSLNTKEKNNLAFPVLCDSTLLAADAFGIAFDLSDELVALYSRVGNDLPAINGNGRWALPVPATFVIDAQGVITQAHVDVDYRRRAEPAEIVARMMMS